MMGGGRHTCAERERNRAVKKEVMLCTVALKKKFFGKKQIEDNFATGVANALSEDH